MNKNIIAIFAAVAGLSMASCETPKDLRPEDKVSVDFVEPGTRNTYNIGKVNEVYPESHDGEVMPDRDLGGNTIQPGDSIRETTETNTEVGATKEQ
ncbi:hypothetical protein DXT99_15135 [Pontibacter diazotrophicus]|uniref:Uncharacterized protein n=1 Tax=Pontibacter diazotrophicus TaxID=1400979 RepID=A0A3D8LAP1_9BACT|nr:hypothetical protein [Pontibacter diazotrophicus]RDV14450.1 hypothetical protein DXT99_15135 [Pontibacter diazotrophicus]